jgi:hypothetical protein
VTERQEDGREFFLVLKTDRGEKKIEFKNKKIIPEISFSFSSVLELGSFRKVFCENRPFKEKMKDDSKSLLMFLSFFLIILFFF